MAAIFGIVAVGMAQKPADMAAEKKKLTEIAAQQSKAKAAYVKNKKSPAAKTTYVKWTMTLAENTMYAKYLSSKEKYPKALRSYREVLTVDPTNKEAKQWVNMIESIYKQSGKPIPR